MLQKKPSASLSKQLADKKRQLSELEATITERKKYLCEQEVQIKAMVDAGNAQLHGLHTEIAIAQHVLKDTKGETRLLRQDKRTLERDVEDLRQVATSLAALA